MGKEYYRNTDESEPAWQAFIIYRDMGEDRSSKLVAAAVNKDVAVINKWSSKWRWRKRIAEYDNDIERARIRGELKAVENMRSRQVRASLRMQTLALMDLERRIKQGVANDNEVVLKPREMARLLKDGMMLERLNRGEPSEITQAVAENEFDYTKLSTEDLRALRDIKAKMKANNEESADDTD